jgi:hypothetical protein
MPTKKPRRAQCRPNDPPSLHEKIIRALIDADPRMFRNGFWQEVNAICKAEEIDCDGIVKQAFRPDAYLIDRASKHINIVEVEVSHPMTERKKDDYAWWWYLWDCEMSDWEPRLFVVDRYGHGHELGLGAMYWRKVFAESRAA